jgi:peptidoglycan lytic transglycosylase
MGLSRGLAENWRWLRLVALAGGCLALANCAGGGKIDPRYGVASSERVVPFGQPVPKGGGVYRVGKPYEVAGRTYYPREDVNYSAVGTASWYGDAFHGRYTANGEIFDENAISAAHPTMPLPSYARITNLRNHRSIVVRVNDRGPYAHDRLIDVSVKTAKLLGFYDDGTTKVKVQYVGRAPLAGSDDNKLMATLRGPHETSPVRVASARSYAPTFFDTRTTTRFPARMVAPASRPYRLGDGEHEAAAVKQAPTTELAAASRPQGDAQAPAVSPVSAYAPVGYDGHSSGFMDGRGLY